MASHDDSEKAGRDPDGITSLLAVDQDTSTKTTKLMTVTESGVTKLHVKADTELSLDGAEVHIDNIMPKASTAGTSTGVSVGSSSTTVLALNANRNKAIIVNDSNETIYLKYGSGAELNKGIRLNEEGGAIEELIYTGIITAISTSGSKNVTVCEL